MTWLHFPKQRAAMINTFFATNKKHSVNPFHWLKHTLEKISNINHKHFADLYPQNLNKMPDLINM
jgi:hypothetical protein